MKFTALLCGAALMSMAGQASATTITFDGHAVGQPPDSYPSIFAGPVGFTDQGFQFSNNAVILNVSSVANGPAYSGNNAAFNDYYQYGYGPEFTITKSGGGTFSFSDVEIQSWSHSANNPVSVEIDGFLNGSYVGIITVASILGWTNVSTASPGALGTFANIDKLVITPSDYALIDNLRLNVAVATTPIPGALLLFTSALGGLGLFGWQRRRQTSVGSAA
ncbi:hypothetical protein [Dongia sedimenti]|uniref:VPLPA-CTERM sorting domain-containing protein n=1 Tax=Dongia sedimenti TaxID=3064282 RepID=A0ABU0YMM1_9PROT|nr:hypothetical protein [Rhodospirillaceae bacterium R-7]